MRHAGGRHRHRRPPRRGAVAGSPGCSSPDTAALARDIARVLDDDDTRQRLSAAGARPRRRAHVGGNGDGHARRARRRSDAPPAPPGARADARPLARALHSTWPLPSSRTSRFCSPTAARSSADTKTYLYLDPGRLLAKAPVHVGPGHRARHGHPPDPRLPVPDGPVLLAHADPRVPRLGRAAASGSARSCSPPARACCSSCARWAGRPASRRSPAGWSSPPRSTCSRPTSSTTPRASR